MGRKARARSTRRKAGTSNTNKKTKDLSVEIPPISTSGRSRSSRHQNNSPIKSSTTTGNNTNKHDTATRNIAQASLDADNGQVDLALKDLSIQQAIESAEESKRIATDIDYNLKLIKKAANKGIDALSSKEQADLAYEIHAIHHASLWLSQRSDPEVRKIWVAGLEDIDKEEFYKKGFQLIHSNDILPLDQLEEAVDAYESLSRIRESDTLLSPRGMAVQLMSVTNDMPIMDLNNNSSVGNNNSINNDNNRTKRKRKKKSYDYDDGYMDDEIDEDIDNSGMMDVDDDDDDDDMDDNKHRKRKSEDSVRESFWKKVENCFAFLSIEHLRLLELSMTYDELQLDGFVINIDDAPNEGNELLDSSFSIPELGTHWSQLFDDPLSSNIKASKGKRKRENDGPYINNNKKMKIAQSDSKSKSKSKSKSNVNSKDSTSINIAAMNALKQFGSETASSAIDVSAEAVYAMNNPLIQKRIESVQNTVDQHVLSLSRNPAVASEHQQAISSHSINQRLLAALIPIPKVDNANYKVNKLNLDVNPTVSDTTYVKIENKSEPSRSNVGNKTPQLRPRRTWPLSSTVLKRVTSFGLWNEEELNFSPGRQPIGFSTPIPSHSAENCLPTSIREVISGSLLENAMAVPKSVSSNKLILKKTKSSVRAKQSKSKSTNRRTKKGKNKNILTNIAREHRACYDLMRLDIVTAPPKLSGEEAEVGTTLLMDGLWDHMSDAYAQRTDDEVCALLRKEQIFLRQQMRENDKVKCKLYPRVRRWNEQEAKYNQLLEVEANIERVYKKRRKIAESTVRKAIEQYNAFIARHGNRSTITGFEQPATEQAGIPDTVLKEKSNGILCRIPSFAYESKYTPYTKFYQKSPSTYNYNNNSNSWNAMATAYS